jgi:threonine/homoserine/homoserine lactone efflux protein
MAGELGGLFAAATAVAISPVPIVAVILILFSRHPRRNGVMFLLGWILGLVLIIGALLLLPIDLSFVPQATLAYGGAALQLFIGGLLVAAAFVVWRRTKGDKTHPLPRWTARIEQLSALQALELAVGLAVVNPKNLALAAAVILSLMEAGVSSRQARLGLLTFVCLGSLTIAAPVSYRILAGKAADRHLQEWKEWLVANNTTVLFVLLLLMGMLIIGKGAGSLLHCCYSPSFWLGA